MKYTVPYIFMLLVLSLFMPIFSSAQVWPGDANNDGQVSNLDLVYMGFAFGQFGPARDSASTDWAEQRLPIHWENDFPNTTLNYAFADCDGDGIVSILDVLAISSNYQETQPVVQNNDFERGIVDIDPGFSFVDPMGVFMEPHLASTTLSVDVHLGSDVLPLEDINGLAFTIRYDEQVVDAAGVAIVFGSSWLNPSGNQLLQFQRTPEPGMLEVGVSNFGRQASSGSGFIGKLFIIIEDDIIGFLPGTDSMMTDLILEDIVAVDTSFNEIPIASDTLHIKVVKPSYFLTSVDVLPESYLSLFPNPVSSHFVINSNELLMESISIYNTVGQLVQYQDLNEQRKIEMRVGDWEGGMYILKVKTDRGLVVKKIIIK